MQNALCANMKHCMHDEKILHVSKSYCGAAEITNQRKFAYMLQSVL